MKGLGRLMTALNPLAANAATQAGKAGLGTMKDVWSRVGQGVKAIASNPSAYFGGGKFADGTWAAMKEGGSEAIIRRATLATGVGWAGSNLLAPDSGATKLFNTAGMAAGWAGGYGLAAGKSALAGYAVGGAGVAHIASRLGII